MTTAQEELWLALTENTVSPSFILVTQGVRVHGFIDMLTRVDFQMHTHCTVHTYVRTHAHPIAPSVTLSAWLILSHNPLRQTVCTDVTYNKEWISSTFSSLLSTLLLDSLWAQSVVHRKPEEQYTNHNKHAASLDFCSAQHGHVDTDWFSI